MVGQVVKSFVTNRIKTLDKTWDCLCHGSRFDYTGKKLYDPAFKDLEKIEL